MTEAEKKKAEAALAAVAAKRGITLTMVRESIREAIDEAWEKPSPKVRERQQILFPCGKPSPEEFLVAIANSIFAS